LPIARNHPAMHCSPPRAANPYLPLPVADGRRRFRNLASQFRTARSRLCQNGKAGVSGCTGDNRSVGLGRGPIRHEVTLAKLAKAATRAARNAHVAYRLQRREAGGDWRSRLYRSWTVWLLRPDLCRDRSGIGAETGKRLMKHATSRELYDYWNRLRRGQPAPHRSDIEPSDIRRILADTFILEVGDRESYVIRLAGTRVCALYGREIKSTNFLNLWAADDREAIATLATAVSSDAAAAVLAVEGRTPRRRTVACEFLLLPLRHGKSGYDRVLGSLALIEQPYWIGSEPVTSQTVTSLRLIWPDERPHFRRRTSDRAQATEGPVVLPIDNRRQRGHLFVLDGGKD
jgi:hypothetical protein